MHTNDPNINYYGRVLNYDSKTNHPNILLNHYQVLNKFDNVVLDNSNEKNEFVVVSTENFDAIEVVYSDAIRPCLWHRLREKMQKVKK